MSKTLQWTYSYGDSSRIARDSLFTPHGNPWEEPANFATKVKDVLGIYIKKWDFISG